MGTEMTVVWIYDHLHISSLCMFPHRLNPYAVRGLLNFLFPTLGGYSPSNLWLSVALWSCALAIKRELE